MIDKINSVWVRFENPIDKKLEVKVRIDKKGEANIRIDQQDLIDAGAITRKGALKRAEKWMIQNKKFVLNQIKKQLPSFWKEGKHRNSSKICSREGLKNGEKY